MPESKETLPNSAFIRGQLKRTRLTMRVLELNESFIRLVMMKSKELGPSSAQRLAYHSGVLNLRIPEENLTTFQLKERLFVSKVS